MKITFAERFILIRLISLFIITTAFDTEWLLKYKRAEKIFSALLQYVTVLVQSRLLYFVSKKSHYLGSRQRFIVKPELV